MATWPTTDIPHALLDARKTHRDGVSKPLLRPAKELGEMMVQSRRRAGTVLVALMLASVLLLTLAPVSQGQMPEDAAAQTPEGRSASSEQGATPDHSRLLRKAEREGSARVIVRLRTDFVPEGRLDRPEAADQRDEIQGARTGLQEDLGGTGYQRSRASSRRSRSWPSKLPPGRSKPSSVPRSPRT
jgi:hypothetical protein